MGTGDAEDETGREGAGVCVVVAVVDFVVAGVMVGVEMSSDGAAGEATGDFRRNHDKLFDSCKTQK